MEFYNPNLLNETIKEHLSRKDLNLIDRLSENQKIQDFLNINKEILKNEINCLDQEISDMQVTRK